MAKKKHMSRWNDPTAPAWAAKPELRLGYGKGMFFDCPIWFETRELVLDAGLFKSHHHHYASLILRALQWSNGPLYVESIGKYLKLQRMSVPRLIDDLKKNGWVVEGDRIHHVETEARRQEQIGRAQRRKEQNAARARTQSKRLRFAVLEAHGFACRYCGRKAPEVELHVDHVEPISRGGADATDNLVAACADCNMGKADRPLGGA